MTLQHPPYLEDEQKDSQLSLYPARYKMGKFVRSPDYIAIVETVAFFLWDCGHRSLMWRDNSCDFSMEAVKCVCARRMLCLSLYMPIQVWVFWLYVWESVNTCTIHFYLILFLKFKWDCCLVGRFLPTRGTWLRCHTALQLKKAARIAALTSVDVVFKKKNVEMFLFFWFTFSLDQFQVCFFFHMWDCLERSVLVCKSTP